VQKLQIDALSQTELQSLEQQLAAEYQTILDQHLSLDLTRGKPSSQQLDLSDALDGILQGQYKSPEGTDTRNYGGLDGLPQMRQLGAEVLGLTPNQVLCIGNASLTLMHYTLIFSYMFDSPNGKAWKDQGPIKFLCPVPGYDRHFSICQDLGIEMINIPMSAEGPDMDLVEEMVASDHSIKGIWCVPKYSNPTGIVYSDAVVERMARLGTIAASDFRVFWDNAYAIHDLVDEPVELANLMTACQQAGTSDSVWMYASTSKITHAGAGIAFIGASEANLAFFKKHLGMATIGPDKVNQLRHAVLLPDMAALKAHMLKHAELLKPRFDAVLTALEEAFGGSDMGDWETPQGGYFVSFNTRPGLAQEVVKLSKQAGVVLTPAGATFPYGRDPEDRNIRLAPSFPSIADVKATMQVFVTCVKLASVRQALAQS